VSRARPRATLCGTVQWHVSPARVHPIYPCHVTADMWQQVPNDNWSCATAEASGALTSRALASNSKERDATKLQCDRCHACVQVRHHATSLQDNSPLYILLSCARGSVACHVAEPVERSVAATRVPPCDGRLRSDGWVLSSAEQIGRNFSLWIASATQRRIVSTWLHRARNCREYVHVTTLHERPAVRTWLRAIVQWMLWEYLTQIDSNLGNSAQ